MQLAACRLVRQVPATEGGSLPGTWTAGATRDLNGADRSGFLNLAPAPRPVYSCSVGIRSVTLRWGFYSHPWALASLASSNIRPS